MYWSYLSNSQNTCEKVNILTFESNADLKKLSNNYCELIIDNFFSSFSPEYDSIFISEFNSEQEPLNNEIKFYIKFNDFNKAYELLKNEN